MSRIERWEIGSVKYGPEPWDWRDQMVQNFNGRYVTHEDCLSAVTLAKIEVLQEFLREVSTHYTNRTMESDWAQAKIAALRKELEG